MTNQPNQLEISCDQCRELLSDYIDRELSAQQLASVEQHLSNCGKCGTESARLLGLKNIIQRWDGVQSSGEFPAAQASSSPAVPLALASPQQDEENEVEAKRLPPFWVLLGAVALAAAAYYLITFLRGIH
jgi:anti-sigma factor RsiW